MAARVRALLVTRERPPPRTWRVDGPAGEVYEAAVFVHDLDDMPRIIFPVGRQENAGVRAQFSAQCRHELRTHQTAFVMALLRPRIGKEYIHTGEALIAHLIFDEAGRIPTQNAYVLELAFSKPAQQPPEPRAVNLDAEIDIVARAVGTVFSGSDAWVASMNRMALCDQSAPSGDSGCRLLCRNPVEPVPTNNVAMSNYALRARKGRLFGDQPVRLFVDPLT